MKHIPLTYDQVALVSDVDYDFLLGFGSWCYSRSTGYAVHYGLAEDGHRTTYSMHRLVKERELGHPIPRNMVVDHVNRNRLDNRRGSLRLATRSQNQANKGPQINTPFELRGITQDGSKFRARIRFDRGKALHLGMYHDPVLAARVYDCAGWLLNAEFAGLNYPNDPITPEVLAIACRYIERNTEAVAYLRRVGRYKLLDAGRDA